MYSFLIVAFSGIDLALLAQARADYFGTGTGIVNCPTTWDTDYCAAYKAGYVVEWNLQKVLRPELDNGR